MLTAIVISVVIVELLVIALIFKALSVMKNITENIHKKNEMYLKAQRGYLLKLNGSIKLVDEIQKELISVDIKNIIRELTANISSISNKIDKSSKNKNKRDDKDETDIIQRKETDK